MRPTDLGLPPQFSEFRTYPGFDQLATAMDLATASERFQLLNAATGSGKSVTYAATAALCDYRWAALVVTKGLQSQLLNDGLVSRLVYSHRNYTCAAWYDDAANAIDIQCRVPREYCQYRADVAAAIKAKSVVANYAYWLSIARYSDPQLLGEFDLLVLDEAHAAPGWLAKSLAVTITPERLERMLGLPSPPRLPTYAKIGEWYEWASDFHTRALDRLARLGRDEGIERRKVQRLVSDLETLATVSNEDSCAALNYTEPWIVMPADGSVEFRPRWGTDFAERLLFRGVKRVLLTSATVTMQHAKYLGIKQDEMRYREIPSPFDVRRRPIIYVPTARVDFRMSSHSRWKVQQRVDEVISMAIDQRAGNGVIHTGSYDRTRETVMGSEYRPAIITHGRDSREFAEALEKFKAAGRNGQFAVMASPRMVEGVDLPDDLARWQIILKCPFPDSRDPLTRARAADGAYRDMVVVEIVMQMCGRPVRSNSDFATTVVLDDHWGQHVSWKCSWPHWFAQAFIRVDNVKQLQFLTRKVVDSLPPPRRITLIT